MSEKDVLELALRRIMGACCETFTTGLGSCWRAGREVNATFGADQVCAPCIAHRALFPSAEPYRELVSVGGSGG